MAILTPSQIYAIAQRTFGDLGQATVDLMTKIALLESGGDTTAYNGSGLDNSTGLWQINTNPAANPQFASMNLTDPTVNAQVARQILLSQGPTAWTTYQQAQGAPVTSYNPQPVGGGLYGPTPTSTPLPADPAWAAVVGSNGLVPGAQITAVDPDGTVHLQSANPDGSGGILNYTAQRNAGTGNFTVTEVTPGAKTTNSWQFDIGAGGQVFRSNAATGVVEPTGVVIPQDPKAGAQPQAIERADGSIVVFNPTTGKFETTTLGAIANNTPIINERTGESFLIDKNTGARISLGQTNWPTVDPERTFQEDQRQFDTSQAGTNWRFGTDLAEQARQADQTTQSGDWRFGTGLAEDARQTDNALAANNWQFGTGLAENARTTDNALNATNWRFGADLAENARTTDNALNATNWRQGENLAENARQFNVGEQGTNDRARLQAALGGFQSVNQLAPQLGQLALQNAQFTADMTQNPADFIARAFMQRGGQSPLPVVSQADLINQLTNNISGYNNVLSQFNTGPLSNPTFLNPSGYGGYTNPVDLQQAQYGSYANQAPALNQAPYGSYGATQAPAPAQYGSYGAPAPPTYPGFGSYPAPQFGGAGTGGTALPAGTTVPKPPIAPVPLAPKVPLPPTTAAAPNPYSYLDPRGDPYSAAAQQRLQEGLSDSGPNANSIEFYSPPPSEYGAIAQNAADLYTPQAGQPDFNFSVDANGTLVATPMAFGGTSNAPMMLTGDSPSGRPTGYEELITNPPERDGMPHPIGVTPNPGNQMGIQTTPPMSFGGPGGGNMPAPTIMAGTGNAYGMKNALPSQASPQAMQSRFGGVLGGLNPLPPMMPRGIPRYATGTDWTDTGLPPVPTNTAGTVSNATDTAVTNNLSSPAAFYQSPPAAPPMTTMPTPYNPTSGSTQATPDFYNPSIGMQFGAPQLPTQPQVTQQQLIDYARQYSPPAVSAVINGTMPETLRFGFPLPNPQQLSTLTDAERQALNSRLAVEFNSSIGDVESAVRQRFTNARQRPRGRYAVGQ